MNPTFDKMDAKTRSFLYHLAKKGDKICYKEMCGACYKDLDFNKRVDQKVLYDRLTKISEFEHNEGRPLLSILVVKDETKKMPGDGFFKMALRLGKYNGSEKLEEKEIFFDTEFKKVCDYWSKKIMKVSFPEQNLNQF